MSDTGRPEQNSSSSAENESYDENEITNEAEDGATDTVSEEALQAEANQWNVQSASLEYPNPLLDCLVLLSKYS
ncbi:hypothetical protein MACH16_19980 [Marinomonas pontica]|uniref:Uncharacterized protein n=1 Tax=Marinomonas pontica TaxID=264739 RepID=A0ABM8FFU1_9GAMM|nr:hypothetical protein MACH16_19980 [Marinomonas pontica]